MKAEIVTMTKRIVDDLIGANIENRHVRVSVVDRYARDMLSGHWRVTNQGIGVTKDGVLIDGQHRLLALRKCNYPQIKMLIVWGLDEEAKRCVDGNLKRSARDIFALSFNTCVSKITPAILNILGRYEVDSGIYIPKCKTLTVDEMYDAFEIYGDPISTIAEGLKDYTFYPAPVLAAAVFITRNDNENVSKIRRFLEVLRTGENINKEMPEFHLRNFLMSSKKMKGDLQLERYLKSKKAMLCRISDMKLGVLKV